MRSQLSMVLFLLAMVLLNACGVPGVGSVGPEPAGEPALPEPDAPAKPTLIQGCYPVTLDGSAVLANRITDGSIASTTWTSGGYIRVEINDGAVVKSEPDEEVNGEKRWYFDQAQQSYARHAKGLAGDDVVEVCAQGQWGIQ